MNDDPIDPLVDCGTVFLDPKKWCAIKLIRNYGKLTYAAATTIPLSLAFGGALSISNVQARQPEVDPHVPTQTQGMMMMLGPQIVAANTNSNNLSGSATCSISTSATLS